MKKSLRGLVITLTGLLITLIGILAFVIIPIIIQITKKPTLTKQQQDVALHDSISNVMFGYRHLGFNYVYNGSKIVVDHKASSAEWIVRQTINSNIAVLGKEIIYRFGLKKFCTYSRVNDSLTNIKYDSIDQELKRKKEESRREDIAKDSLWQIYLNSDCNKRK